MHPKGCRRIYIFVLTDICIKIFLVNLFTMTIRFNKLKSVIFQTNVFTKYRYFSDYGDKPFKKQSTGNLFWNKIPYSSYIFTRICSLILSIFRLVNLSVSRTYHKSFVMRIRNLEIKGSKNFCFKYLKEASRLFILALIGQPSTSEGIMVSLDKRGFPRIIPIGIRQALYNKDIKGNLLLLRYINTLLSLTRISTYVPKVDFSSIESPYKGDVNLPGKRFSLYLKELFKENKNSFFNLQDRIASKPDIYDQCREINSASPNYRHAMFSIHFETAAIINNGYYQKLKRILMFNNQHHVLLYFRICVLIFSPYIIYDYIKRLFKVKNICEIGRLHVLEDSAGKARVIAIVNYWIQCALYPVHKELEKLISEVFGDSDLSLNQQLITQLDQYIFKVRKDKKMKSVHSIDLKNATDRIPMTYQVKLMNIIGYNGDIWKDIISMPFKFKDKYLMYSTGQPMGAYSSFALLSLTHHAIVQQAFYNSERNKAHHKDRALIPQFFRDYHIVGDDIIIYDDAVAREYRILLNKLDVSCSKSKGLESDIAFEFTKRVFIQDVGDISPISSKLLLQAITSKYGIINLLLELLHKDYLFDERGLVNFIENQSERFKLLKDSRVRDTIIFIIFLYYFKFTGGISDTNKNFIGNRDRLMVKEKKFIADGMTSDNYFLDNLRLIEDFVEMYRLDILKYYKKVIQPGVNRYLLTEFAKLLIDPFNTATLFRIVKPIIYINEAVYGIITIYFLPILADIINFIKTIPILLYLRLTFLNNLFRKNILDDWDRMNRDYVSKCMIFQRALMLYGRKHGFLEKDMPYTIPEEFSSYEWQYEVPYWMPINLDNIMEAQRFMGTFQLPNTLTYSGNSIVLKWFKFELSYKFLRTSKLTGHQLDKLGKFMNFPIQYQSRSGKLLTNAGYFKILKSLLKGSA